MNSKKDIERSASTQGDSIRSDRIRNLSKRRRESTAEFKNFYVKNFKLTNTSPQSQTDDKTSFQQLFTLMHQACTFLPQQFSLEDKENNQVIVNFQRMTPSQAINQLTKKLTASKERYSQLFNQMSEKQHCLSEARVEICQLKSSNSDLRQKIKDLRQQIVFWRQGHEKMLNEVQNIRLYENKQNIENMMKSNKLKQFKNNIKQQRRHQSSKIKIVKPINGVMSLLGKGFIELKDCGIQQQKPFEHKICLENISICQSVDDNRSLLVQTNSHLRQDLRFAQDYIAKLRIKVDCLEKKLKQERDIFKIQKQREFALLKQKLRTILQDYHRFKLIYNQLKIQNDVLKRTLPQDDIFRLSLTPNNKLI